MEWHKYVKYAPETFLHNWSRCAKHGSIHQIFKAGSGAENFKATKIPLVTGIVKSAGKTSPKRRISHAKPRLASSGSPSSRVVWGALNGQPPPEDTTKADTSSLTVCDGSANTLSGMFLPKCLLNWFRSWTTSICGILMEASPVLPSPPSQAHLGNTQTHSRLGTGHLLLSLTHAVRQVVIKHVNTHIKNTHKG